MTMRVRMLRSTGGPDGQACLAGEVYDLPAWLATQWIAQRRACAVDDEPDPVVQSRDPVPVTAPTPRKKRR